jgi:deoxyribonuclease-4
MFIWGAPIAPEVARMYLGAHVSIAKSIALAPERGEKIGAEAIQIFSRSPRKLKDTKPLPLKDAIGFPANLVAHGIKRAIVHANYLINLSAPKKSYLKVAREAFKDELERAQQLGLREVIFHPGAHMGKGEAAGLKVVAESLDWCFLHASAADVFACLENTAGQGTVLGYSLGQLAEIIEHSSFEDRLAVCIDTCHAFAAGFDLRTKEAYDAFWRDAEATVGIARVRAFHLNDSKGDLGSRLDRHENIGKGKLGTLPFRFLVNDERFKELPGCLEYPGTDAGYRRNLKTLRSLIEGYVPPKKARRVGM